MPECKILIVEDNASIAKLFETTLVGAGFGVHVTKEGYGALAYLNTSGNGVSLILTDMVLPGLGGLEFVRQVKAKPSLQHIPIIAVTALSDPQEQKKASEAGCVAYVLKPVRPIAHLVEIVKGWLPKGDGG